MRIIFLDWVRACWVLATSPQGKAFSTCPVLTEPCRFRDKSNSRSGNLSVRQSHPASNDARASASATGHWPRLRRLLSLSQALCWTRNVTRQCMRFLTEPAAERSAGSGLTDSGSRPPQDSLRLSRNHPTPAAGTAGGPAQRNGLYGPRQAASPSGIRLPIRCPAGFGCKTSWRNDRQCARTCRTHPSRLSASFSCPCRRFARSP